MNMEGEGDFSLSGKTTSKVRWWMVNEMESCVLCVCCVVFEDDSPGARAQVILHIDTNETSSPVNEKVNDSGYYSDLLSRLGNGISGHKWSHDSISSDSSNHGDDDNEQLVLGTISVPPEISWISMDSKIGDIFRVS